MHNYYDCISEFYSGYDEEGRLIRDTGRVEYTTTMTYIHKYLQPGARVLEIGAGTGRYAVTLAREGYDVTAVELVPHNLEILKSKITGDITMKALQGNALDLSMLADETFDLTLVLGPMYHLYEKTDKRRAISEAIRVTKRGGILMVAYCVPDASIVEYVFKGGKLKEVLNDGMLDPVTFVTKSSPSAQYLFEMVRKSDVDKLMAEFPVERLHYVATDGLSYFMRREVDEMDEETFRMFLKYHLTVCENLDLVGATAHSLDIFRRLR